MVYSYRTGVIAPFFHKFKRQLIFAVAAVFLASIAAFTLSAGAIEQTVWEQDFESDASGWLDDDDVSGYGNIEQVPSGTNGITSADGSGHGLVTERYPFSRFDGYRDTWPGQWTAEVDVYLDTAWSAGEGFDYSVAANGSDGNHQRDFIFHVAQDTSTGDLLVGGTNNSGHGAGNQPKQNIEDGNHYVVGESGWYTFQHVFRDDGGQLAVDMNLVDESGTVLFTETRTAAADTIPAEVGGNRYAWFTIMNVPDGLAIDNHSLVLNEVADTEKPTLEFVDPATSGMAVSGTYDVKTHATDNDMLKRMAVNVYDEANSTFLQPCGSTSASSSLGVDEYEFTCSLDTSELGDGTYTLRAGARDESDNVQTTSTQIVVDSVAPLVTVNDPSDGDEVDGAVSVLGTVEDDNLSHYNASLYPDSTDLSDGMTHSGDRLESNTVNTPEFVNQEVLNFDSATYEDGEYQVRLAARDLAGNRDVSDPFTGGTSSVHVVSMLFDNYVDNKKECKNGGWERGTFEGETFRNQGDCVSYFASDNHTGRGHEHGRKWWKFWDWNWSWNQGWSWWGNDHSNNSSRSGNSWGAWGWRW